MVKEFGSGLVQEFGGERDEGLGLLWHPGESF